LKTFAVRRVEAKRRNARQVSQVIDSICGETETVGFECPEGFLRCAIISNSYQSQPFLFEPLNEYALSIEKSTVLSLTILLGL
jgi:hypothetical protein